MLSSCDGLADLFTLADLKNLKTLDVESCGKLKPSDFDLLKKELPDCKIDHDLTLPFKAPRAD